MSRLSNGGFTLAEVMVAMLISLVGILGLLQAVNISMEHNLRNQLRDEAVQVAEKTMGSLKARPFSQISGVNGTTQFLPKQLASQLRGGNFRYSVFRTASSVGTTTARLRVRVGWSLKGQPYEHSVMSIRAD